MAQKTIKVNFKIAIEDFVRQSKPDSVFLFKMEPSTPIYDSVNTNLVFLGGNDEDHDEMIDAILNDCILVFDCQILEWNATPEAVRMEDNDMVLVLEKSFFSREKSKNIPAEVLQVICNYFVMSGNYRSIPENLNNCVPIPLLSACKMGHPSPGDQQACDFILKCIEAYLLKTLKTKLNGSSKANVVFQDFEKIEGTLQECGYEHTFDCIQDIISALRGTFRKDIIIGKKCTEIVHLFLQEISGYSSEQKFKTYWDSLDFSIPKIYAKASEKKVVMGLERTSKVDSTRGFQIRDICLHVNENVTLGDLINDFCFQNGIFQLIDEHLDFTKVDLSTFCYDNLTDLKHEHDLQCLLEPVFQFQKRLGLCQIFNLRLPRLVNAEDKADTAEQKDVVGKLAESEDLNLLLEYIEGEKDIINKKRKKRKKKKKTPNNLFVKLDEKDYLTPQTQTDLDEGSKCEQPEDIQLPKAVEEDNLKMIFRNEISESEEIDNDDTEFTVYTRKKNSKVKKHIPKTDQYVITKKPCLVRRKQTNKILTKGKQNNPSPDKSTLSRELGSQHRISIQKALDQLQKEFTENKKSEIALLNESTDLLGGCQKEVEVCEDKIFRNNKICSQLEMDIKETKVLMAELGTKISVAEEKKKCILEENIELKNKREMCRLNRLKKEEEVDKKFEELSEEKEKLLQNIKVHEQQLAEINTTHIPKELSPTKIKDAEKIDTKNGQKKEDKSELDFLKEQIKKKEQDLECPVCLETSQVPIYMCQEQHIICKHCWIKVNNFICKGC